MRKKCSFKDILPERLDFKKTRLWGMICLFLEVEWFPSEEFLDSHHFLFGQQPPLPGAFLGGKEK